MKMEAAIQNTIYEPPVGKGRYILTPTASVTPRVNGPSVFGVRPGSPFLYTIPASGKRPMHFWAEELPEGLRLDENTGIISGIITDENPHEHRMLLCAENEFGSACKEFIVKVGNEICLTPPLGWNSWNCWGPNVAQQNVLASARAMVEKGLHGFGWTYINIDDGWQGARGGEFNAIQPDPERFPDLGKLCEQIHELGLKVGIYSSPWKTTYAHFVGGSSDSPDGAWDAEGDPNETWKLRQGCSVGLYTWDEQDAAQWAAWGIDYLKYDWFGNDPENTQRMSEALKKQPRDIVYSLSNQGAVEDAEFYAETAHCLRTTGDLKDRWDADGRNWNFIEVCSRHRAWIEEGAVGRPGFFPDADMLVVGDVVENNRSDLLRPSRLTADEQYFHMSLWVLWASPLLIGCPVEAMDDFTLNLLTNAEVLDVHQDALAVSGRSIFPQQDAEIVVKDLADGGKAVGLFNLGECERVVTLDWMMAGLQGSQKIRDVWRQKDVGVYEESFSARVPPHGVIFIRTTSA